MVDNVGPKQYPTPTPPFKGEPTEEVCKSVVRFAGNISYEYEEAERQLAQECVRRFQPPDGIQGVKLFTEIFFVLDSFSLEGEVEGEEAIELITDDRNVFVQYYYLYSLLTSQDEGIRFLINSVNELRGGEPISIFLDDSDSLPTWSGLAILQQGIIWLVDTMGIGRPLDGMTFQLSSYYFNPSILKHELGHHLMYHAYGQRYPFYEGGGHDLVRLDPSEHRTSPAAAWTEGFAHVAGFLDGGVILGGINNLDFMNLGWRNSTLSDKLSNEWAVALVLGEFISKEEADGTFRVQLSSFKKLVSVLSTTRVHQSLQEFIVDFIKLYPEDREKMQRALRSCFFTQQDIEEIFTTIE